MAIISGHDDKRQVASAFLEGASIYMKKPACEKMLAIEILVCNIIKGSPFAEQGPGSQGFEESIFTVQVAKVAFI